jgi:hypothetical protein
MKAKLQSDLTFWRNFLERAGSYPLSFLFGRYAICNRINVYQKAFFSDRIPL